jgi:hypothetical protein
MKYRLWKELGCMKTGWKMRWGAALWAAGMATAVVVQAARAQTSGSRPRIMLVSTGPASAPTALPAQVVREIDDPNSGARWLLMRDPEHPGGPGRLIMVSILRKELRQDGFSGQAPDAMPPPPPIIRAGEQVIVEENSPVVEARLEGVALNPAGVGSSLEVRLQIGGKVVQAVALAPGRATLQPETEPRP